MTDMQKCFDLVWAFREEHGDVWKTPDVLDSLRCAYSEMGEAYSEFMRLARGDDFRARQKDPELPQEMADVAIMLITALGDYRRYERVSTAGAAVPPARSYIGYLDDAGRYIAFAIRDLKDGTNYLFMVKVALDCVAGWFEHCCLSLEEYIAAKLQAIGDRIDTRLEAVYA